MPGAGAHLGSTLLAFALVILIESAIGAVILRAAIALYNKMSGAGGPPRRQLEPGGERVKGEDEGIMAGGPRPGRGEPGPEWDKDDPRSLEYQKRAQSGVPVPTFGRANRITFVTILVQKVVGLVVVGFIIANGAQANGAQAAGPLGTGAKILVHLIELPFGFLVMARMLPTSFGKAMLVTLLTYVTGSAIYAMVEVVFALAMNKAG